MSKTTFGTALRSFEQYAKRNGLATADQSAIEQEQLEKFKGLPFWIWDKDKHRVVYEQSNGLCCFNHTLPFLPVKNGSQHPFYPWQKEIFDALENHRLLAILKARGIGGSEAMIRWAFYLCVRDNKMQGTNMCVITGIREDLSVELIRRFKNLMPDLKWNTRENLAELNGCRIIGYPSKRVKDLRGLTDVSFVICDEFDHFDPSDQMQVLPVLEAFQAKSNPTICLLSTPGPLGSEMNKLFDLPEEKSRYKRIHIPIQKAIGSLISEREAEKVRRSPNYLQEFELRFQSYGLGSIFSMADLDFAQKVAKKYEDPEYNAAAKTAGYPTIGADPAVELYAIGVDPGWTELSQFSITCVGWLDGRIHVFANENYVHADEDQMIRKILAMRQKTGRPKQTKIYIDSANMPFIKRLKGSIPDERIDYTNFIEELRKHKWIKPPEEAEIVHYMSVIPIPFSKFGVSMLANLYAFLSKGQMSIHPKFQKLISSLQSAKSVQGRSSQFVLDKSSMSLDALDSLRLSMFYFEAEPPTNLEEIEEEQEAEVS